MGQIVERDVIIKALAEFCAKYPTRGKAAKALKVTPAQLSQTLNKKNNVIPERILKRLGYRSEMMYLTITPKAQRAKKPVATWHGSPKPVKKITEYIVDPKVKIATKIGPEPGDTQKFPVTPKKAVALAPLEQHANTINIRD